MIMGILYSHQNLKKNSYSNTSNVIINTWELNNFFCCCQIFDGFFLTKLLFTSVCLFAFKTIFHFLYLIMDMSLPLSYTRFSCSLIKWNTQLAKITIPPFHPLYPIASPLTGWTNWPKKELHDSKLNWRMSYSTVRWNRPCFINAVFISMMFV